MILKVWNFFFILVGMILLVPVCIALSQSNILRDEFDEDDSPETKNTPNKIKLYLLYIYKNILIFNLSYTPLKSTVKKIFLIFYVCTYNIKHITKNKNK